MHTVVVGIAVQTVANHAHNQINYFVHRLTYYRQRRIENITKIVIIKTGKPHIYPRAYFQFIHGLQSA